jgi:hypothetical protein
MQLKSIFLTAITAALLGTALIAARAQSAGGNQPPDHARESAPVLVELFTSEGCSSCPPADELLRQINGKHTDSGRLIVGVSEHVTYWNQLGWSDPFSSATYTQRQDAYGQRFHLDSVYTPQMVINGEEQFVGSDSASLLHALNKKEQPAQASVHIDSVTANGNALTIAFSASGDALEHGADIFAIVAEDAARSNVLRGENSGRTLAHVSVARVFTRVATVHAATEKTVQVPLAIPSGQGRHLILFAQAPGLGRVLGVDSKPL